MTAVRHRNSPIAYGHPAVTPSRGADGHFTTWDRVASSSESFVSDGCTQGTGRIWSASPSRTTLIYPNKYETLQDDIVSDWQTSYPSETLLDGVTDWLGVSDQGPHISEHIPTILGIKFLDAWTEVTQTKLREAFSEVFDGFGAFGSILKQKTDAIDATNGPFDKIIQELARLNDGWDDCGALAPSDAVISNIMASLIGLSEVKKTPVSYVDIDGSVSLKWSGNRQVFALTYNGDDQVIGTLSPFNSAYRPWKVDARDERFISQKIDVEQIKNLVI